MARSAAWLAWAAAADAAAATAPSDVPPDRASRRVSAGQRSTTRGVGDVEGREREREERASDKEGCRNGMRGADG
eukprot:2748776-Rhodomonas_salina.1